jgi:hypothetical protein
MNVFKNRILRRIFGSRWNEITGEWRKLHNEKLNDLYSSPNIVRMIKSRRWAGNLARMFARRGVYRVLVRKPEEKRPLWRTKRRWEDKIEIISKKWDVGLWTGSRWLRIWTGGEHLIMQ